MNVEMSVAFQTKLKHFLKADKEKIFKFVQYVHEHGLEGLEGRNKSSAEVPTDDPNWLAKVQFAQKYQLWHYHIGIPHYETAKNGEKVSEYILHYIRQDDKIKLVAMSYHPPFELPNETDLA